MARTRRQELEAQLRIIADELAKLDQRPAEPLGEYPAVGFTVRFGPLGPGYTFAARKAGQRWYTTGTANHVHNGRTWDQLLDWIQHNNVGGIESSGLQEYTGARLLT